VFVSVGDCVSQEANRITNGKSNKDFLIFYVFAAIQVTIIGPIITNL